MADSVRIVGLRELGRTLKKAGDDLADLKDAHAAVASMVAAAAAAGAPKRTGRLASSGRGNRAAARAVVQFGGARLPYAPVIHWGWSRHHIVAQPFASKAAQATEPRWVPVYEASVAAIVAAVHGA